MAQFKWDKEEKKAIKIHIGTPVSEIGDDKQEEGRQQDIATTEYLESMTDEQLAEMAAEKGLDLSKIKTRAQLIKVLDK